jgi:hypothetical protein
MALAIQITEQSHDETSNAQQWQALKEAERDISDAWLKEGLALKKIRDEQLFLLRGYASFVEYYQYHLKYHKSTVSLRMSAAETALKVRLDTEQYNPSQAVYRELSFVPDNDKQEVLERACEISVANGDERLMQKHVKQAKIEYEGGYDPEVIAVAETWGFSNDIEKLQICQAWYDKGKDNPDGKFWALAGSGVIDPADGKDPVEFATASISDISNVEWRWQKSKIQADNPNPAIEGLINGIELMVENDIVNGVNIIVNGQNVKLPIVGKTIKMTIKIME